jgi:ATP-dependent DNA helicase RecG
MSWRATSAARSVILDVFTLSYRRFAVAGDVIEENHRTIDEQLAALRFFDARAARPTNAGVLLFGRDPVYFLPGAYVQHVRYDGTTLADEVSRERRFEGDLLTVLRGLDSLAEDLAETRPEPLPSGGDQLVHAYPPRTLHELLMNAVIHRNYDGSTTPVLVNHFTDRVEIQSPGGLYGDLTAARFPGGTSYRNPIVAEAAKVLGFVNRFGRGIAIAQALLAKNGSRPAEFDVGSNHLSVTIWRRR